MAPEMTGKTITRAELARAVYETIGLVEAVIEETVAALVRGEDVKVSGFVSFMLRDRPERPLRNPRTGETATVRARRGVVFRASGKLKARMNRVWGRPGLLARNGA